MNLFNSFLQITAWIGVGYNIRAHNNWAIFGFVMYAFVLALAGVINMIGKQMRDNGHTSK